MTDQPTTAALPTAEAIASMTTAEKVEATAGVSALLIFQAEQYRKLEALEAELDTKYDERYAPLAEAQKALDYQVENFRKAEKSLIDERNKVIADRTIAREAMRKTTEARYHLTGEKTYLGAFQTAVKDVPKYEYETLFRWILEQASGSIKGALLSINTKAVEIWLMSREDGKGGFKPVECCEPIPAIITHEYTPKVISDKLATLPAAPKSDAQQQMVASTSEYVKSVVAPVEAVVRHLLEDADLSTVPF